MTHAKTTFYRYTEFAALQMDPQSAHHNCSVLLHLASLVNINNQTDTIYDHLWLDRAVFYVNAKLLKLNFCSSLKPPIWLLTYILYARAPFCLCEIWHITVMSRISSGISI